MHHLVYMGCNGLYLRLFLRGLPAMYKYVRKSPHSTLMARSFPSSLQFYLTAEHFFCRTGHKYMLVFSIPAHLQITAVQMQRTSLPVLPLRIQATVVAQAPVPQASVTAAPRSHTRIMTSLSFNTCTNSTLVLRGKYRLRSIRGPQYARGNFQHHLQRQHNGDCPY